ncbi:MAG: energy-coupling factor transporter transmembrane component T [Bacilli bacterium]
MNITLGKYQGYDTVYHKIDARIKLVALILFMVSVFLSYGRTSMYGSYTNIFMYIIIFIMMLVLTLTSHSGFIQLFKSLKALWVMMLFLLLINLFLPGRTTGDIAFSLFGRNIYYYTIINLCYIIIRLILVLMMTTVFTSTTKPMEMTSALEWLFYPLKFIKVPIHKIAMAISLALRFIPTLIEETNRIMKAQASRGVDFNQGKIKEKIKALISLIIPLFMTAFTTSGELADAMEARGYDPDRKRTRYKRTKWSTQDTIAVIVLALYCSAMIYFAVQRFDVTDLFPGIILPKLSN